MQEMPKYASKTLTLGNFHRYQLKLLNSNNFQTNKLMNEWMNECMNECMYA